VLGGHGGGQGGENASYRDQSCVGKKESRVKSGVAWGKLGLGGWNCTVNRHATSTTGREKGFPVGGQVEPQLKRACIVYGRNATTCG